MRPRRFVPSDALTQALVSVGIGLLVVGLVVGTVAPAASVSAFAESAPSGQSNPADVETGEDLSAFERQLADRLAREARSGTVNLSNRNYDEVREELNGSRYEALLDEYESIASESGTQNQTLVYRRMLDAQEDFVAALERYDTLHARYERLRDQQAAFERTLRAHGPTDNRVGAAGVGSSEPIRNPQPVYPADLRSIAHELERAERAVDEAGAALLNRYQRLEDVSNESFAEPRQSVVDRLLDVTFRQAAVERETLDPTLLSITESSESTSMADPLVVRGRLTANEIGVGNATVELALGEETATSRTDSDGRFEITLRPRAVSLDVERATLRYLPENDSAMAASERSIQVNLTRAEANATVAVAPDTVGFGDKVTVAGRVTAEKNGSWDANGLPDDSDSTEVGVDNASVVVRVGSRVLARNETEPDGTYEFIRAVPSRVPEGDQLVTVTVRGQDRPVGNASVNTTVTVVERTTRLSVTASQADERTLEVRGNLTTTNAPVGGHQVLLLVGDTPVGTARTNANGSFVTTVSVPSDLVKQGFRTQTTDVELTVVFSERGNLAGTEASTTVGVTTGNTPLLVGAVLAVVLLIGGALWVVRRLRRKAAPGGEATETDSDPEIKETPDQDYPSGVAGSTDPDSTVLASAAADLLGSDPERAVRVSYAALRRSLAHELSGTNDRTHWEFYRACLDADLDDETLSTLRDVTEQYEHAAFAADSPGTDGIRPTVERVASLVEDHTNRGRDGDASGGSPPATGD